jgi:hypothetical protein
MFQTDGSSAWCVCVGNVGDFETVVTLYCRQQARATDFPSRFILDR